MRLQRSQLNRCIPTSGLTGMSQMSRHGGEYTFSWPSVVVFGAVVGATLGSNVASALHARLRPRGTPSTLGQQLLDLLYILVGATVALVLVGGALWWALTQLE
jgi:hypothetical protein